MNMNRRLYRIEVEVEPMQGTTLPPDCAGAYVNVYLAAVNIIEAIKSVESELLSDLYMPINTYGAFELDLEETDYDTDEEGCPGNKDLLNLKLNGGIWYGPFHLYPPEDNQLQ